MFSVGGTATTSISATGVITLASAIQHSSGGILTFSNTDTSGHFQFTSGQTLNSSSGTDIFATFGGTINQTGSAATNYLVLNPTLTAAGTGRQNLLSIQGNSIEKFVFGANGTVGFGTSTPRFPFQIATTSPQITLSSRNTDPAWHLWNIFGNLFLATSSPTTFATSTTDVYRGYVMFPAKGGCVGCTDIHLPSGINLLNGLFAHATSSQFATNVMQDIYTAPAGRRAMLVNYNGYAFGGGFSYQLFAKIAGTYYGITSTSSPTSGSSAGGTQSFILEPGESIGVLPSVNTVSNYVRLYLVEYDVETPFRSPRVLTPSALSTTTLYTVPANVTAQILGPSPMVFNASAAIPSINGWNNTPTTVACKTFIVMANQTATENNSTETEANCFTTAAVTANILSGSGATSNGVIFLNELESLQFWNRATLGTPSMVWTNIYEH